MTRRLSYYAGHVLLLSALGFGVFTLLNIVRPG